MTVRQNVARAGCGRSGGGERNNNGTISGGHIARPCDAPGTPHSAPAFDTAQLPCVEVIHSRMSATPSQSHGIGLERGEIETGGVGGTLGIVAVAAVGVEIRAGSRIDRAG